MTAGDNNLHGTLRFLSKKYSSKAGHRRGPRGGIPGYRNSLKPRNDKLQVVSIVPASENDGGENEAPTPKGPSVPETKVGAGTPASQAVTATTNSASAAIPTKEHKTAVATKTTTTTILLRPKDLEDYDEAEKAQQEALKKIEQAREKVYKDQIQQVWGVYLYGLKHVLALNDLSNSPDSILPGNF